MPTCLLGTTICSHSGIFQLWYSNWQWEILESSPSSSPRWRGVEWALIGQAGKVSFRMIELPLPWTPPWNLCFTAEITMCEYFGFCVGFQGLTMVYRLMVYFQLENHLLWQGLVYFDIPTFQRLVDYSGHIEISTWLHYWFVTCQLRSNYCRSTFLIYNTIIHNIECNINTVYTYTYVYI